uniref:Uncharacterized protein n=1 Tax=Panagrolaimus sp. PS1159 TaxID=55785 RepID=A0AC35GMX1_9BILA
MKQKKYFKFLTNKQIRKRSESSQSSSQEETLAANAISPDCCHKCEMSISDAELKIGVPLICTFDKCPYNHRRIHRTCFEAIEKENYHFLKHCGKKTAKWSESKIWKVMWKRAGLRLLKRRLRCPCKYGYFCKDNDSYIEMKKIEEEDFGYDSDVIIEDEPAKVEDIKTSLAENKKDLVEQTFNPFEAEKISEEPLVHVAEENKGGEPSGRNIKNIFKMYFKQQN